MQMYDKYCDYTQRFNPKKPKLNILTTITHGNKYIIIVLFYDLL